MKRFTYLALVLVAAMTLFSCNQKKVKQLEEQKAALETEKARQDSMLNEFMATFNQFEENLQAIKEKENLINMGSNNPEYREDGKEAIIADIQSINDLLDQNRQIIDELTAKANKADGLSSEYRRTISRLKNQLAERTQEIATLKEQLAEMNFRIEDLNGRVDTLSRQNSMLAQTTEQQSQRIAKQQDSLQTVSQTAQEREEALNTAYYVMGTSKELKQKEVITREGGFIGIGGARKLAEDFNQTAFNRIDIREMTEIPVDSKKAELLTVHPSGTYEFKDLDEDKAYDVLEIKDPSQFWKTSKYLVVMTN
jgi:DNA repair exonuclease SbcCD ATPase subunit